MEWNNDSSKSGKGGSFKVEQNRRFAGPPQGDCASLSGIGGLGECVECVIAAGAYISFGRTSDGGATLIRVLDGSDKLSSYCHSAEEVEEALSALLVRYGGGRTPTPIDVNAKRA